MGMEWGGGGGREVELRSCGKVKVGVEERQTEGHSNFKVVCACFPTPH